MSEWTEFGRLIGRFASVGVISSGVYVVAVACFVELAHLDPMIASGLSYVVALPVNFLGNRSFTFQSTGDIRVEIAKFMVVHAVNVSISTLSMYWAVEHAGLTYWIGSAMAVAFVPISTFLTMKLWVFAGQN